MTPETDAAMRDAAEWISRAHMDARSGHGMGISPETDRAIRAAAEWVSGFCAAAAMLGTAAFVAYVWVLILR